MTWTRLIRSASPWLIFSVVGLLVSCTSPTTNVRMNISAEDLRTPPHRLSKVDYPFDANGNYIDAWAAGNSSGVAPSYYNSDLEDRAQPSTPRPAPTPPPPQKRPTIVPPEVRPLPAPPPLTSAPPPPSRPATPSPYLTQTPNQFRTLPNQPSSAYQNQPRPVPPQSRVIPVQPYQGGQPQIINNSRPMPARPTGQPQVRTNSVIYGPDGRPLPPAYRVPSAGN